MHMHGDLESDSGHIYTVELSLQWLVMVRLARFARHGGGRGADARSSRGFGKDRALAHFTLTGD